MYSCVFTDTENTPVWRVSFIQCGQMSCCKWYKTLPCDRSTQAATTHGCYSLRGSRHLVISKPLLSCNLHGKTCHIRQSEPQKCHPESIQRSDLPCEYSSNVGSRFSLPFFLLFWKLKLTAMLTSLSLFPFPALRPSPCAFQSAKGMTPFFQTSSISFEFLLTQNLCITM